MTAQKYFAICGIYFLTICLILALEDKKQIPFMLEMAVVGMGIVYSQKE